jgi:hypothetical protein
LRYRLLVAPANAWRANSVLFVVQWVSVIERDRMNLGLQADRWRKASPARSLGLRRG